MEYWWSIFFYKLISYGTCSYRGIATFMDYFMIVNFMASLWWSHFLIIMWYPGKLTVRPWHDLGVGRLVKPLKLGYGFRVQLLIYHHFFSQSFGNHHFFLIPPCFTQRPVEYQMIFPGRKSPSGGPRIHAGKDAVHDLTKCFFFAKNNIVYICIYICIEILYMVYIYINGVHKWCI